MAFRKRRLLSVLDLIASGIAAGHVEPDVVPDRVALLPRDAPNVVLSTSTTYYRVDEEVLLAAYLATFLRSHYFQRQLQAVMEQTTRNQVSVTKQVEFGIAVPPIEEQREIVRRVQALWTLSDQQEARLAKAQALVDRLRPALLANAFSGELVPTEAELARREGRYYEPASVLLERVRQQRVSDDETESARPIRPKASIRGSSLQRPKRTSRRAVTIRHGVSRSTSRTLESVDRSSGRTPRRRFHRARGCRARRGACGIGVAFSLREVTV